MITKYQPICDVWRNKRIIAYEATTEGFLEIIRNADPLDVSRIDFEARAQALNTLVPKLSPNQRLFVNLFPGHQVGNSPWFAEDDDLTRITLEVTEHQVLPTDDRVLAELTSNRQRGMQVALDDFGVGSHALKLVEVLHPEYIKLDKYFVKKLRVSGWSTSIPGMLKFCEEGDISLIVEGVESREDYDQLVDLGVRYMQGWYLGLPQLLEELFP